MSDLSKKIAADYSAMMPRAAIMKKYGIGRDQMMRHIHETLPAREVQLLIHQRNIHRTLEGVKSRSIRQEHGAKQAPLEDEGVIKIHIPADVLAERTRRIELSHASVTAALCGDPLPGYSALDKAQLRQDGAR